MEENRRSRRCEVIFCIVITLFAGPLLTLIAYYNAKSTTHLVFWETTWYVADRPWIHILLFLLLVTAAFLFQRSGAAQRANLWLEDDRHFRRLRLVLLSAIIAVSSLWVVCTQFQPGTDELELQNYVCEFVQGNYEGVRNTFDDEHLPQLARFSNNRGLFLFYLMTSRLFGTGNYLAYEMINAFAAGLFWSSAADIGGRLGLKRSGMIAILLVGFCYFPINGYSIMVYGNLMSLALSAAAVNQTLAFFEDRRLLTALWAACLMTFAVLMKSNAMIWLIAVFLTASVKMCADKEIRGKTAVFLLALILGFSLQQTLPTQYLRHRTGYPLDNASSPLVWVAMGLSDENELYSAPGWWNCFDQVSYYESRFQPEVQKELAVENIRESLQTFRDSPFHAFVFFSRKLACTWANPSFQVLKTVRNGSVIEVPDWVDSLLDVRGQDVFSGIFNYFSGLILAGSLCELILGYKKKPEELVLPMIFVGGVLFLLVWETKPRYAILYFAALIPYAFLGYQHLVEALTAFCRLEKKDQGAALRTAWRQVRFPLILCTVTLLVCLILYAGPRKEVLTYNTDAYQVYLAKNGVP